VPASQVLEVTRLLTVEPQRGMPQSVLGVSVVRGELAVVHDAAQLLGLPPAPAGWLVVLRGPGRRAALAVGAVLGVGAVDPGLLARGAELAGAAASPPVAAILTAGGETLTLLDVRSLWRDDESEAARAASRAHG
jgi:chemotaxis signal transduction protein